jgi:hypothetical protein
MFVLMRYASPSSAYEDKPDAEVSAPRAPGWAQEHLEVLRDLRDMGMTLARNLTRQVVAQTEADEARAETGEAGEAVSGPPRRGLPVDPALSFSRISRAVRLTLALEARTHQAIEDHARRGGVANDDARADDDLSGPIDYEGIARAIQGRVRVGGDFEIRRAVEESPRGSPYATIDRPPDPRRSTGTERYRQARGLPPLEGPLPLRAARGPPS